MYLNNYYKYKYVKLITLMTKILKPIKLITTIKIYNARGKIKPVGPDFHKIFFHLKK